MSTIPYAIVRARRTTGWLLLAVSVLTAVALALGVGAYLTAAPTVRPISQAPGSYYGAAVPSQAAGAPAAPAATPGQQLADLKVSDAGSVSAIPDGYWVAQLASNRPGTDAQGHVWDDAEILADHMTRRDRYGGALLWSGDFRTFKATDYWVTIVPSKMSSTPEPVLAWCVSEGIDRDHCVAKRLSTTDPWTGDNTKRQQ